MSVADTFCRKCQESLFWCPRCLDIIRAADAQRQRDASTVPALRKTWEALDATYWEMLEELRQTTTTQEFKRYVERCRLRASDAYRRLEEGEVEAGIRSFLTADSVYPEIDSLEPEVA